MTGVPDEREPHDIPDQERDLSTDHDSSEVISDLYATANNDPYAGAVPPGYDWPTHGGYLGCLLGLVVACAVSGFLGGTWFAILAAPSWVRLTITLVASLVFFGGLGRLGWVLGKRFYREYPQPARGRSLADVS